MREHRLRRLSAIVNRLREARGGHVTVGQLLDAVWTDPDDEPEFPENTLYNDIWALRKMGYTMIHGTGRGYQFIPDDAEKIIRISLPMYPQRGHSGRKFVNELEAV